MSRRVLVVGGGVSGISAAIELADVGLDVVLVEKTAALGGRVAGMYQYFPKLCPPACGLEINLRRLRDQPAIRCMLLSEVERVTGGPGDYHVRIRSQPQYVSDRCTACGACLEACPVERPDERNFGLATRRAIYGSPDQSPQRFAIDEDACLGGACARCVSACAYGAIDLQQGPQLTELEAGAVLWATGWQPYDAARLEGLGFGAHPDVITNVMLERLASPGGPTAGQIRRPSTGGPVQSVVFVQCAGSRDLNHLAHCSGVCCAASLKQVRYIRAQYPEASIRVFYIDLRTPGRLEEFQQATFEDDRLTLTRGKVARVTASGDGLEVQAEDTLTGGTVHVSADLVVLAVGLVPNVAAAEVEGGLERDESGFLTESQPQAGMVPVGCAKRPADVTTCVRDATAAALHALQYCGR